MIILMTQKEITTQEEMPTQENKSCVNEKHIDEKHIDEKHDDEKMARTDDSEEVGGREGLDPTRYGDWEKNGRCIDF